MGSDYQQDKGTMKEVTGYLFGEHVTKELSNLDIRTDVPTKEMFELLHYYQDLEILGLDAAKDIKDAYMALLISIERKGRIEGVTVLEGQKAPKVHEIKTGMSKDLEDKTKSGEGEL